MFIGSQAIGYHCLNEILKLKIEVKAIFTFLPEKHEKWEKSVDELAEKNKIKLFYPEQLTIEKMRKLNPQLIVVIGYRKIFPNEILDIPKFGVVGIHSSLLPILRGQAPLNWAIILGHKKTGATLFKMDKGIDTGKIIDQVKIPIKIDDTVLILRKKIEEKSKIMIRKNIKKILLGKSKFITQPENGTYGCARIPEDGKINWEKSNYEIHNLIRASDSSYPAFTFLNNKKFFITLSKIPKNKNRLFGSPGQVGMTHKDGHVTIITGDGELRILEIENSKRKKISPKVILNSTKLRLG